jgi:hypothetical protein
MKSYKNIEKALNKERDLFTATKKKIVDRNFNNTVFSTLSTRLNPDMSRFIRDKVTEKYHKEHLEEYSFANIRDTIAKLTAKLIKKINEAIFRDEEIEFEYKNKKLIPERDFKKIYELILLVLKHFPNKLFTLSKFKFSQVRKYFVYKVNLKNRTAYPDIMCEYLLIDYKDYENDGTIWVYGIEDLETLNNNIKEHFTMINPVTNIRHEVSMNRSERSSRFDSKSSSRSSLSSSKSSSKSSPKSSSKSSSKSSGRSSS